MNSKFNKETSEGLYIFSEDEVFEALKVWCDKKGITLEKKSIKSLRTVHKDTDSFVIELSYNHRSKNATSTQESSA
jgi:hypothetical protein